MSIWKRPFTLEEVNARGRGTMVEHLDIQFTHISDESLTATMPVDARTKQPAGILHGGASVVLAETIGSTAANMCVDSEKFFCVGLEINANHLRSVTTGHITGIARPIHLGRTTQVWDIRMQDADGRQNCVSRLTMAVLERKA